MIITIFYCFQKVINKKNHHFITQFPRKVVHEVWTENNLQILNSKKVEI